MSVSKYRTANTHNVSDDDVYDYICWRHQTELPPRIKSHVLQNLLGGRFPGSRSSRNLRSERTLRDHVNNKILKNQVCLVEFDAEYKKCGTLTYDKMMRDVD